MENELVKFVKANKDWKEILSQAPYHLKISQENSLFIFSYNQILSDFSLPLVQHSRGVILHIDEKNCYVVCEAFRKFFNYGEEHAASIDWNSARVLTKIDGSIIKLYNYNGEWRWATNGTINAFNTDLPTTIGGCTSFGELAQKCWDNQQGDFGILDPRVTYIFELTSPWNRVVVPYKEETLWFLGARFHETGEELNISLLGNFPKPAGYPLKTAEDVLNAAKLLDYSAEGYVVVDTNFNRVKIKSPAYVRAHRLANNHVITEDRALEIIKLGEQSEFLNYFPEYSDFFNRVEKDYKILLSSIEDAKLLVEKLRDLNLSRKEFANIALTYSPKPIMKTILFALWDNKNLDSFVVKIGVDDL